MTELQPPYVASGQCYPVVNERLVWSDVACVEGVAIKDGNELQLATNSSGLEIRVHEGGAFINSNYSPAPQGMYHVYNDELVVLTAPAADPSNPRIDTVVAHVLDAQFEVGTTAWALEIWEGTPTAGANLSNLNGADTSAGTDTAIILGYVFIDTADAGPLTSGDFLDARVPYERCGTGGSVISTRWSRTSSQGIPNNTTTTVAYSTNEGTDSPSGYWSHSAGVTTILKDGAYLVIGQIDWAANATGRRYSELRSDGVAFAFDDRAPSSGEETAFTYGNVAYLEAGAEIEMIVNQTSGGSLNLESGTSLTITRLGVLAEL